MWFVDLAIRYPGDNEGTADHYLEGFATKVEAENFLALEEKAADWWAEQPEDGPRIARSEMGGPRIIKSEIYEQETQLG